MELADSRITYRVRYLASARLPVLDLMLLDDSNPRSLTFAVGRIAEHIRALPALTPDGRPSPALEMAQKLATDLANVRLDEIGSPLLIGFENRLMHLSNALSDGYFSFRGPDFR